MHTPQPIAKQFSSLMDDISTGRLKIPQFQREFIWEIKKSTSLLDSIVKNYPIGTFIFWKTKERLRSIKNIGNLELPEPEKGDYVNYVLDGQQRITSIFAALKGEKIRRNDREEDFSEIYIDLNAKDDGKIVTTEISDKKEGQIIKLKDLLYGDISLIAQFPKEHHKKLDEYRNRINSYNYSIIQVDEVPIDIATEIFTRINVGGVPLTLFEIMVAKTYDYEKNFDLAQAFDKLIDSLREVNYETISDVIVLQLISLIIKKECKRKVILNLDKNDFISLWNPAIDSIERAVDYFRSYYRIPVSELLPYNTLIVLFAYFFYYHNDKPTGNKQKYLQDFFWRVSLSGRYTSATESKLAQDIKRIDKILKDESPEYDWPINNYPDYIKDNGFFSAGRSYIKAILCIYAYQQPKSFNDNSIVNISNDWLKQANSRNYHHFFPKAYLGKLNKEWEKVNHILNITIVDDFLNKREIRDKPPSIYMKKFEATNPTLTETMKTHLINDLDGFGVWTDNYDIFFDKRAEAVSREIQKQLIKRDIDDRPQADLTDDISEEIEVE